MYVESHSEVPKRPLRVRRRYNEKYFHLATDTLEVWSAREDRDVPLVGFRTNSGGSCYLLPEQVENLREFLKEMPGRKPFAGPEGDRPDYEDIKV